MKIPKAQQLPSGNWRIQITADGHRISITEADESTCVAKAMAYKSGILKAKKNPQALTLRDACSRYIDGSRNRLSPTTIQGYEVIRDFRFQSIMDTRLDRLTHSMLDRAVERESGAISPTTGKRYSAKSIKNSYGFISSVLKQYAPDVDRYVRLPEVKRKPVTIIEPEVIFKAVKGSTVELPCLLSMWLSLSMSEIRGLTKSKSIHGNMLSVVETVVDVRGTAVRKTGGKEEERSRTLEIPEYIKALIEEVDGDVIVPLSAQTISKRFYRILEKNNLPHINFHKLRHINASVMAMLGIPEKDALERGGWKTDSVYKQVYTHTFTAQRKLADKKINDYFTNIIERNAHEIAHEN